MNELPLPSEPPLTLPSATDAEADLIRAIHCIEPRLRLHYTNEELIWRTMNLINRLRAVAHLETIPE